MRDFTSGRQEASNLRSDAVLSVTSLKRWVEWEHCLAMPALVLCTVEIGREFDSTPSLTS